MDITEIFSLVGVPARIGARILILLRYVFYGATALESWTCNDYARARFGRSYKWRLWLLFDIGELERLERLLNEGQDSDVLSLRDAELDAFRLVAVVGALLAQAAISALSLPSIEQTHGAGRGMFIMSLVLSLLAIFFTCVQQRELGFIRRPHEIRAWLSNGVRYQRAHGTEGFQSSMVAHQLLQAPFEMMGISITLFVGGLGVYLGSAWARDLDLGSINGVRHGNMSSLAAFIAGTGFASALFGFLVGQKGLENKKSKAEFEKYFDPILPVILKTAHQEMKWYDLAQFISPAFVAARMTLDSARERPVDIPEMRMFQVNALLYRKL